MASQVRRESAIWPLFPTNSDDVLTLMEKIGIEKSDIIGHSMGDCIAQSIAYRYPDKISSAIFPVPLLN